MGFSLRTLIPLIECQDRQLSPNTASLVILPAFRVEREQPQIQQANPQIQPKSFKRFKTEIVLF